MELRLRGSGDTEKEARDFLRYYVHEKGDWEAATSLVDTMGLNAKTIPPEAMQSMKAHFIAGWVGYPLVGDNNQHRRRPRHQVEDGS